MSYHYAAIPVSEIQKTDHAKYEQACRASATLLHWWWECKMAVILDGLAVSYKAVHLAIVFAPRYFSKSD
jgi:hypothetical protein